MGALTWEGLLGSLMLVLTVIAGIVLAITAVFGSIGYVFTSGVQAIRGLPTPDFGTFMLGALIVVAVALVGAINAN